MRQSLMIPPSDSLFLSFMFLSAVLGRFDNPFKTHWLRQFECVD